MARCSSVKFQSPITAIAVVSPERHVLAADRLRAFANGAAISFSSERDLSLPVTAITYRPISGPGPAARRQAKCWKGFVRAMAIFTFDQCQLLTHCVLLNLNVDQFIRLVRLASNR
jgi:hypothetical protein